MFLLLLLAACSGAAADPAPTSPLLVDEVAGTSTATTSTETIETTPVVTTETDSAPRNRRVEDAQTYELRNQIPFDAIRPIYNPEFGPAGSADLFGDELVMGVAWGGEAKAYPVTVLRRREMVNDELAGIPILATW